MTEQEIRQAVLGALGDIAPEVDTATVRADVPLREQVDLDSMDLLNLLTAISRAVGVDIPERDYARMTTVDDCVSYLRTRL